MTFSPVIVALTAVFRYGLTVGEAKPEEEAYYR
jgi:hypothetical protein